MTVLIDVNPSQEVGDRDHHLSIDTRLLVMTSAVSELQAQLTELNELRERVRKAELARRSRRVDRRKRTRIRRLELRSRLSR